jgi:hypothetical protein
VAYENAIVHIEVLEHGRVAGVHARIQPPTRASVQDLALR